MAEEKEPFLARWSRVKREAQVEADAQAGAPRETAQEPPPQLPPVEKLGFDSDYTGFFHPKVTDETRRAALKRLFSDPHFNVMDGLDVYIDDYSKPSPLPAEMLAGLKQAQRILAWAAENLEQGSKDEPAAVGDTPRAALDVPNNDAAAPANPIGAGAEPVPANPSPEQGSESK